MERDTGDDRWVGTVESLAPDGNGIGVVAGKTADGTPVRRPIFLQYAVPGDRIAARITDRKGKYLFGEIEQVLEPSPHRVPPPCPHFTICGGCNLQHIAYDEQLRQKARVIAHQLAKAGIAIPHEVRVLPSRERHSYRRRGRIAARFQDGNVIAGFRRKASREIIPVGTCFIVDKRILDLVIALNKWPAPAGMDGEEIEILAVVGDKGKLGLLVRLDDLAPASRAALRAWLEELYASDRALIGNVLVEERRVVRALGQVQEHFTYAADGLVFGFTPETFIQANIATDETLIERTMAMLTRGRDAASMSVIDLYAGIGNLGLPAAKRCARVVAVEGYEASVYAGRANAIRNGLANIEFLHQSAERCLKDIERDREEDPDHTTPDAIIIDPPRTGLSAPARVMLERSGVSRIVYISCDPVTLARDLRQLSTTYRLADIVGIDMFPDISHVETACLLERVENAQ